MAVPDEDIPAAEIADIADIADIAPRFTLLESGAKLDAAEVERYCDYPTGLKQCWVRANMIASVDGAAAVDGRSGDLAGPGDRAMFTVLREVSDVVLVGAGTVRAENYSGAQLDVAARQRRQARGQTEIPPIAVVTASGAIEPGSNLLTHTETPPLVFTAAASSAAARARLDESAEVIAASTSDPAAVDLAQVLAELTRRGLHRVLCEGGPTLLGSIVAAGLLDELAVTVAPMLVAGTAPRILGGQAAVTPLRITHTLTDDNGYYYLRYRVAR